MTVAALESLSRLQAGNERFVSGTSSTDHDFRTRRAALVQGQTPFAIILGCADSRAPAELIFDQGLGDLFVIRVAGNVVTPAQIASVEFAASKFGSPLVVVMGHTHCGAIAATIGAIQQPTEDNGDTSLQTIVDCIRPAVERAGKSESNHENLMTAACRANIQTGVEQLCEQSPLLSRMCDSEQLMIVGAEYDIETGTVEFFDSSTNI